jgi:hypothetical protein
VVLGNDDVVSGSAGGWVISQLVHGDHRWLRDARPLAAGATERAWASTERAGWSLLLYTAERRWVIRGSGELFGTRGLAVVGGRPM